MRAVRAPHRPGAGFEAARVVGEVEPFEGEGERVPGGEPAGPLRANAGDQLWPNVKEGGPRPTREPLEAAADEGVAVHRRHVDGHAAAGLVAVDEAQGALRMGGVGDRTDVLEVAGGVEEVGRHHERGALIDSLGERLGRDRYPVGGGRPGASGVRATDTEGAIAVDPAGALSSPPTRKRRRSSRGSQSEYQT